MLIHMAEASCPELDERECVISASQEAIFEQLLGALPPPHTTPTTLLSDVCWGGMGLS